MKKSLMAIAVIGLLYFFIFIGCAPLLQTGASLIGEDVGSSMRKNDSSGKSAKHWDPGKKHYYRIIDGQKIYE